MARSKGPKESVSTAVKLLGALNLHQCLWLPESSSHGRLRVTFSTTANFDDSSLPAVLFVGPMFGSRYGSLLFDKTAKDVGVRVICVDRPGIGGSSPAPLEQRIKIWLETVRALLDRLNVKHVSLVSHSAGTTYSFNTLYYLRDILEPAAPFVAYLGPWVHPEHSRAAFWNMISKLPEGMINSWHNISQFMVTKFFPMTAWSGGVVSSAVNLFQTEQSASNMGAANAELTYGVDEATAKEIDRLQMKYLFSEGAAGADQEALLCLKRCKPGTWDVCEDYRQYVRDLVELEKERHRSNASAPKLEVRVYLAESDFMIGKGGAEYFSNIWRQDGVSDFIRVQSINMPDTDHDTLLLSLQNGAIRHVLEEIRRLTKDSSCFMVKVHS